MIDKWPEILRGLLLAVYVNAAGGSLILAIRYGKMAQNYLDDIRNGINGLTRPMMVWIAALSVHLAFVMFLFCVVLLDKTLIDFALVPVAFSVLFLFLATIYLHQGTYRDKDN